MERNETMQRPRVTLVDWPRDPLALVWILWRASKDDAPLSTVEEVRGLVSDGELVDLFRKVLAQRIPLMESLRFVFVLEGVSVSWREQAVRHRIGTSVGPRVGVDIVPDLSASSWWSQSGRLENMSGFADRGAYREPDFARYIDDPRTVDKARKRYRHAMQQAADAYRQMLSFGLPIEEAREVMPFAMHHRISWALNLAAIQHIVGKRSCWILQSVLWAPVIRGMIDELAAKVHPIFRELVHPPCVKDDTFDGCVYRLENERRVNGSDPLPMCPLWACMDAKAPGAEASVALCRSRQEGLSGFPMLDEMKRRAVEYEALWGRDPYTWGPIERPIEKAEEGGE